MPDRCLDPHEAARKRAFRRFLLTHHPDHGGDPEQFRLGLERFRQGPDRERGPARRTAGRDIVAHRRRPPLRTALTDALRRLTRSQPARPPRVR